jgi:hypothetical protein
MTACGFPNSKIGHETILCNLETGAYFSLGAVGSRFPELLERDGSIAVRTMLGSVRRQARGSRSRTALRDLRRFVQPGCTIEMLPTLLATSPRAQAAKQPSLFVQPCCKLGPATNRGLPEGSVYPESHAALVPV